MMVSKDNYSIARTKISRGSNGKFKAYFSPYKAKSTDYKKGLEKILSAPRENKKNYNDSVSKPSDNTYSYNRKTKQYESSTNFIDKSGYERSKTSGNLSSKETRKLRAGGKSTSQINIINATHGLTNAMLAKKGTIQLSKAVADRIKGSAQFQASELKSFTDNLKVQFFKS